MRRPPRAVVRQNDSPDSPLCSSAGSAAQSVTPKGKLFSIMFFYYTKKVSKRDSLAFSRVSSYTYVRYAARRPRFLRGPEPPAPAEPPRFRRAHPCLLRG